jgi:hypothetical protein
MLIPFGILSAAGGGEPVALSDYELISTTVLGSAASSVTFSSLGDYSSSYKHLQIRWTYRGTTDGLFDSVSIRFNGDTTSSYSSHRIFGGSSGTVTSDASTSVNNISISSQMGGGAVSGAFSAAIVDILDPYSTTKNTTIRGLAGRLPGASEQFVSFHSGLYFKTNSITSVTLSSAIGAGSRFSIYGIRG